MYSTALRAKKKGVVLDTIMEKALIVNEGN